MQLKSFFLYVLVLLVNPLGLKSQCTVSPSCLDDENQGLYTVISESDPNNFFALIAAGKLLPYDQALSVPQNLIVCGQLDVNVPTYVFAPGSEIVFATNNSGIKIASGSYLQIRGSHLHGCSQLWKGIQVSFNARLDLALNTLIEDAVIAVQLDAQSTFLCTNSQFDGNYVSIYAGQSGAAPGSIALSGAVIHSTVFSGAKSLLQPYTPPGSLVTYSRPAIGIEAENISAFYIGLMGTGTGINTFKNFTHGLYPNNNFEQGRGVFAINSNVNLVNCQFIDIGTTDDSERGYAINGYSVTGTHRISIGGPSGSDVTFQNVTRAVSLSGMRLNMVNCRVNGCHTGVFLKKYFSGSIDPTIFQATITGCRMENICYQGIHLDHTMPSKSIYIANNQIIFNSQNSNCQGEKTGIVIENTAPGAAANANNYVIFGNTIQSMTNPVAGGTRGIRLDNVEGIRIEQNNILEQNANNTGRFNGVLLNNAGYSQILNNTISGTTINYSLSESAGILNKESGNTELYCNWLDMMNQGILFNGFNCDPTNMSLNDMGTHKQGLFLEDNTRIDEQFEKNNHWAGSLGQIEAKFNLTMYDPNNVFDQNFVKLSRFDINTYDENSTKWANPRLIKTDPDALHIWFTPTSESTGELLCSVQAKHLSRSNQKIIDGTFGTYKGLTNTNWEASYHTFGRLFEFPELRPTGSTALNWYSANYNANFAKLYRVMHDMSRLGTPGSNSETAVTNLDNLLAQRDAKETAWATETNPTAQAQRKQELESLNAAVVTAQMGYETINTGELPGVQSQIQNLLFTLSSLSLTEGYEQDMRTVFRILLESNLGLIPFTTSQLTDLESIAGKCRLEGGYAVVLARAALDQNLDNPTADADCSAGKRNSLDETPELTTLVYPNPSSGDLTIHLVAPLENVRIQLCDMTGKEVNSWTLSGDFFHLHVTENALSGLYFLKIQVPGYPTEVYKIVFSN